MINNGGTGSSNDYIGSNWYLNKYNTLFTFGGGTSSSTVQTHDGGWTSPYDIKTYCTHQTGIYQPTVAYPSEDTTFDDAIHQIMYFLSLNIIGNTCIHIITDGG